MQRADGPAVVAELGVDVVLDDEAPDVAGPDGFVAALRGHGDAGGALVGGRHRHDAGGAAAQLVDGESLGVHGDRVEAPAGGEALAGCGVAGVLHGEPLPGQDPRDQVERVPEAGADHDAVGLDGHPAHPAEVVGERAAQPEQAAQVGVGELGRRQGLQRDLVGAAPGPTGKRAGSGRPGAKSTCTGTSAGAVDRGGAPGNGTAATTVPAPCRDVRKPSATSWS